MSNTWIMHPNSHKFYGFGDGALNVADCQSSCINDKACLSIDWVAVAADGEQCWHHRGLSAGVEITPHSGVTHYELKRSLSWTKGLCGQTHRHTHRHTLK